MRLLIDISGMLHSTARTVHLTDVKGDKVGAVYGSLRMLTSIAKKLEPEEMIICCDRGHAARTRLYPEYKQNRKHSKEYIEDIRRQSDILVNEILPNLPVVIISHQGVEADDIIDILSRFNHMEEVGIVTGDKDLWQLAKEPDEDSDDQGGVCKIFNLKGEEQTLLFAPEQYVWYKAIVGDASDNIRGIEGIGDVGATKLIQKYETLKAIIAEFESGRIKPGKMRKREAIKILRRNVRLIKLNGKLLGEDIKRSILDQYKSKRLHRVINEFGLQTKCLEYGFISILKDFSRFTMWFRKMERKQKKRLVNADTAIETSSSKNSQSQAGKRGVRKLRRVEKKRCFRKIRRVKNFKGPDHPEWPDPAYNCNKKASATSDTSSRDTTARGTLSSVVRQAIDARTRRIDKALSEDESVLQSESLRRDTALSFLQALQTNWEWVRLQPSKVLNTLKKVIAKFDGNSEYIPSRKVLNWLEDQYNKCAFQTPD